SAEVATTQWSQVLAARDGSDTEARAALEMLCQTYWQPLYAYIRHQGSDPEEARDFTQAYFTELLDKDFLADVDPSKGRFRAFLLASLRHFLSHQRDRARALKRGGGTPTLSLDVAAGEESYTLQPSDEMTPEDVFEHRWALTVLDRAMGRLQLESAESDDLTQFDKLKPYLTSAEPQATYQESAADLGMSVRAIKTAVHRLRKRYGMCLRAEIAQTVANPADTDEEVRHLLATVRP
ncbi:MAG: sigma-70 family RNA polymerase sigma factor, partial [Thermoanaerobaculia bacterium]